MSPRTVLFFFKSVHCQLNTRKTKKKKEKRKDELPLVALFGVHILVSFAYHTLD